MNIFRTLAVLFSRWFGKELTLQECLPPLEQEIPQQTSFLLSALTSCLAPRPPLKTIPFTNRFIATDRTVDISKFSCKVRNEYVILLAVSWVCVCFTATFTFWHLNSQVTETDKYTSWNTVRINRDTVFSINHFCPDE